MSPKYVMDAYMATLFGSEAWDLGLEAHLTQPEEGRKEGIHSASLGRRMSVVVAAVAVAVGDFCFMIELVACRGWHCVFL